MLQPKQIVPIFVVALLPIQTTQSDPLAYSDGTTIASLSDEPFSIDQFPNIANQKDTEKVQHDAIATTDDNANQIGQPRKRFYIGALPSYIHSRNANIHVWENKKFLSNLCFGWCPLEPPPPTPDVYDYSGGLGNAFDAGFKWGLWSNNERFGWGFVAEIHTTSHMHTPSAEIRYSALSLIPVLRLRLLEPNLAYLTSVDIFVGWAYSLLPQASITATSSTLTRAYSNYLHGNGNGRLIGMEWIVNKQYSIVGEFRSTHWSMGTPSSEMFPPDGALVDFDTWQASIGVSKYF